MRFQTKLITNPPVIIKSLVSLIVVKILAILPSILRPKVIVDKEVFYEVKNKNEKIKSKDTDSSDSKNFYNKLFDMTHEEDGITIPLLLFGLSICLFIGKFIKFAILK